MLGGTKDIMSPPSPHKLGPWVIMNSAAAYRRLSWLPAFVITWW